MPGERNWLREELLSKKELRPDHWRNSQSTQTAKDVKIRRVAVRKVCSEKKSKEVAGQSLASVLDGSKYQSIQSLKGNFEEIGHMIYESPQPSQQEPGIEMRLSKKGLWRTFWYPGVNPVTHMGDPQSS